MAELPKIAEEAVKKIDSKLECSICLDTFKEPKLLPCFHIFCKSPCLERLVVQGPKGHSLTCPTCRQTVSLPDNGVTGFQTDFHIEHLFEIRESLEKAKKTNCENCTDSIASKYCQDCTFFLCDKCTELHNGWKKNTGHRVLGVNDVKANATQVLTPTKQPLKCDVHLDMEAKIYCETCSEVICNDCIIRLHRDHNYDLARDVFPKHKEQIVSSLAPLRENLGKVEEAMEGFDTRAKEIKDQRVTVEAGIHREIDQLHQVLDQRRVELVASLDSQTQQKLKKLATQKDFAGTAQAKMSSCLEYAEAGLDTGSDGEVLRMKAPVLKRVEEINTEFDLAAIQPHTEADIELIADSLNQVRIGCQELGEIVCGPVSAENSYATGNGTKFAIIGTQASVEVHPMTTKNREFNEKLNLTAELVQVRSNTTIKCEIKQENGRHVIYYQPAHRGKHVLSIKINNRNIHGSPFALSIVPSAESLSKPVRVVRLSRPYGTATNSKGQLVVPEYAASRISVLSAEGEKIFSFGNEAAEKSKLKNPTGVAIDRDDNIYVVDYGNNRIQKFTPDGQPMAEVGEKGSGELNFNSPIGICYSSTTNRLYVADRNNYRVQVLTTDLGYEGTIGKAGSKNGQLKSVQNIALDDANNIYVTDYGNKRVQVFTADGNFVRAFTDKGNGEKLNTPYGIAIDSSNTTYVSEINRHRVNVFTSQGDFITSFGEVGNKEGQFSHPYKLFVDQNDYLFVSDNGNHRLQVF